MSIGDTITLTAEEMTRIFYIVSIEECAGTPYVIYRIINSGSVHLLFLKNGFSLPEEPLDISERIFFYDGKIRDDDYYLMINKDSVFPL